MSVGWLISVGDISSCMADVSIDFLFAGVERIGMAEKHRNEPNLLCFCLL